MTEPGIPLPETPEEQLAWERDCLRELQTMVEHLEGAYAEPKFLSVELVDSFPRTKICVRFFHRHSGSEMTRCYGLWHPRFTAPLGMEPPSEVALLIHTWILEAG